MMLPCCRSPCAIPDARNALSSRNHSSDKMQQHVGPVQHFTDVEIECWPFDPLHEQDRKSIAADENPLGRVSEI